MLDDYQWGMGIKQLDAAGQATMAARPRAPEALRQAERRAAEAGQPVDLDSLKHPDKCKAKKVQCFGSSNTKCCKIVALC